MVVPPRFPHKRKIADEAGPVKKDEDVKADEAGPVKKEDEEADLMIWDSVMASMTESHKAAMESLHNELKAMKTMQAMKDFSHMQTLRSERAAMNGLAELKSELRSVRLELLAMKAELQTVKGQMKAMQDER